MRLLITRPEPDATALAEKLHHLGHEAVIVSMMSVRFMDVDLPPLSDKQALIFTSANGVRAFARLSDVRTRPVFAVGDATSTAATEAGFGDVRCGRGDIASLVEDIVRNGTPAGGGLLHIAGSVVARDLVALLKPKGYAVDRLVLYETLAASSIPSDLGLALKTRKIDGVLFYSPRTAGIFASLIEKAGLQEAIAPLSAYCLSQAVADQLTAISFARLDIAANPSQDALLKLLSVSSHS